MKIFGKEFKFNNNKVYHAGDKPTPSEIGAAASSHTHNYAGSSSAGGAANSANTLTTARTINGTSFNGSANITTSNWGTARTFTIGNTGKSVNGSGNVSWSLAEIGAANINDSSVATTSVWSSSKTQTEVNTSYNTLRKLLEDVENNMAYYNHTHSDYLSLNGGTVTGYTYMKQGFIVHYAMAGGGTSGYIKVATIKNTGTYQNQSLLFKIAQRGKSTYNLEIRFKNTDHADPEVDLFTKDLDGVNAYLYRTSAGVWDLYIQKSESYDRIEILDYKKGSYMSGISVTWTDTLASSVPSGYLTATLKSTTEIMRSPRFTISGSVGGDNNSIYGGTGDAADWNKHNLIIRSHWGIGFHDYSDACRIVFDTRTGNMNTRGIVYSEGGLSTTQGLVVKGFATLDGGAGIKGATLYQEIKFAGSGTYSDPWSGTGCAIKATGNIAATGIIRANQYLQVGGTPLSIQSSAPGCGGVWIQI